MTRFIILCNVNDSGCSSRGTLGVYFHIRIARRVLPVGEAYNENTDLITVLLFPYYTQCSFIYVYVNVSEQEVELQLCLSTMNLIF